MNNTVKYVAVLSFGMALGACLVGKPTQVATPAMVKPTSEPASGWTKWADETARYYAQNPPSSYPRPIVAPSEPAPGTVAGELRGIHQAIDQASQSAIRQQQISDSDAFARQLMDQSARQAEAASASLDADLRQASEQSQREMDEMNRRIRERR